MTTNIFRPIKIGKEVFHPQFYDENSFVMDWMMEAGGKVPTHVHNHMDEHFAITRGEILFRVNGKKIIKKQGEELFLARGTPHSITNTYKGEIGITVKYTPCADTHRMFKIFSALDETNPGSAMNMMKYLYIVPRVDLREFSLIRPAFVMAVVNSITTIMGKLSGWDKLVDKFNDL